MSYYLKTMDTESESELEELKEIRKYIAQKYRIDCRIVARKYIN